jgi:hypothetical protein
MYTQSRLTFCLIHHTLLAPSPASSAIPASDHVPPDISRMPCASSTRRSHSQSSTDIGPLPMLFLVHHLACTMPWTVSGLHHALDRIRLAPCPGPYPACTMPWTISGLHHALDHIRLAPCPGPYPACTMPWTISGLHHALDHIRLAPCPGPYPLYGRQFCSDPFDTRDPAPHWRALQSSQHRRAGAPTIW